jgi:hypothetical protein
MATKRAARTGRSFFVKNWKSLRDLLGELCRNLLPDGYR